MRVGVARRFIMHSTDGRIKKQRLLLLIRHVFNLVVVIIIGEGQCWFGNTMFNWWKPVVIIAAAADSGGTMYLGLG